MSFEQVNQMQRFASKRHDEILFCTSNRYIMHLPNARRDIPASRCFVEEKWTFVIVPCVSRTSFRSSFPIVRPDRQGILRTA